MFIKPERVVKRVFIHCSASDNPDHDDISVIRRWHVEGNGWKDVAYHSFIKKDGTVQQGRDLEKTPAAQAGHNKNTIATCLHGLDVDQFTDEQKNSLFAYCEEINQAYGGDITFHGHKEVSNKTCPVIDYVSILNLDEQGYMREVVPENPPVEETTQVEQPIIERKQEMIKIFDGYKTHALGAFAILIGLMKIAFEIPEIEVINVLGVAEPWTLITTGWATIAGRSVINKVKGE